MRLILFSLAALLVACDPAASPDTVDTESDTDTNPDSANASDTADDLLYLREEEKLARDVYQVLGDAFGTQIFTKIGRAEQTHMDVLTVHIERLGLVDPVIDDTTGVFADSHLQALYPTLVDVGSVDVVAALTVGASIEDLDIIDIEQAIDRTDDPALAATYDSLLCGSRNHLRSFVRQLDRQGADYTPQYISQSQFDHIITADDEQCGSQ